MRMILELGGEATPLDYVVEDDALFMATKADVDASRLAVMFNRR